MTIEDIKSVVIPLAKSINIPKVGLFGSYAKGMASDKSDVDILIITPDNVKVSAYCEFLDKLEKQLNRSVDIVDYRYIHPVLRDEILRTEVILYDGR